MKINPRDNRLYLARGVASRIQGRTKIAVESIIYNDPDCGSYVDPRGFLVLPNFNPSSGDVDERFALYIVDGNVVTSTIDEAIEAICAFANDADISATSVTMTGCLPATPLVALATRQLTATVLPSGSVQTGTWSTSNALVATVSIAGLVTAVATGSATITFTSTDGGFTATCVVTVPA